ncbi:MAG TPA: hypothetical protein DCE42_20920 [Myxococcales bacterium]|nr:hypothetical protein [Deltaproteobacteria bacterium]HAA57242.1 hypothetical protein [Myxococcales bacterium]|tara:strand:- start:5251 stop:6288 length:1038 start_codon:yes stop_codon:yes gene_type:complete
MKIPKQYAHMAVEVTARRVQDMRTGEHKAADIEQAATRPTAERHAIENFFERGLQNEIDPLPGLQYDDINQTRKALHQELRDVDIDGDGIDAIERKMMSKAGQVALALAEQMMAQEPVQAMTTQQLKDLSPEETMQTIRQAATDHVELGYSVARAVMFAHIDNQEGSVDGVYTGREVDDVVGIPENVHQMNTEHTWPKSRGVKHTPAVSDLHHLFPTDKETNTRRASYPFGIVQEAKWQDGKSKLGYSEHGHIVFEPPKEHRGDIARALFYVASAYDLEMIEGEPEILLQWHKDDPVNAEESARNDEISRFQRNRNPFVDHPDLAEKLIEQIHVKRAPDFMHARS